MSTESRLTQIAQHKGYMGGQNKILGKLGDDRGNLSVNMMGQVPLFQQPDHQVWWT